MDRRKSKRSESRRSSILKSRKPRQPLENVNLNSSNENTTPTTLRNKRRVSFAEKKHVKEFCQTTEQGTVWDSTYEEHDCSFKGSHESDSNPETEISVSNKEYVSKENVYTFGIDHDHENYIFGTNFDHTNSPNLVDSRPCVSNTKIYKDNNVENSKIDFTEQVKYIETSDKELSHSQAKPLSASESTLNYIIYRDIDEEDCANNIGNKCHSQPYNENVNCELNQTQLQDLSMEFTTTISRSLLSSCLDMKKNKQENIQQNVNILHQNSFDTDNITNCNNVSMGITQVVPISQRPIRHDLEIPKQISLIKQNSEHPRCEAISNIFSTNLPFAERTVSKQMQNVNSGDDALELTEMVQPCVTGNTFHKNDNENNTVLNTSMEISVVVSSEIYEKDVCPPNKRTRREDNLKKNWEITQDIDKTEFFNGVTMEMTKPVKSWKRNIPHANTESTAESTDKTEYFNDVIMETMRCENTYQANIPYFNEDVAAEKNVQGFKRMIDGIDKTKLFNDVTMEMTKSANVALRASMYDQENLRVDELAFGDDRTKYFHNMPIEMTETVQKKRDEDISNLIARKSTLEENLSIGKDTNNSIIYECTKLLSKPMDITEAISAPSYRERTCNIMNRIQTKSSSETSFPQTMSKMQLSDKSSSELVHQSDMIRNNDKASHDMPMEITEAIAAPSYRERTCNIMNRIQTKSSAETSLHQTMSKIHLPEKNFSKLIHQSDMAINDDKIIHNMSIEITAAVSNNNASQNLTTNNVPEFECLKSGTSIIETNTMIPEEIAETTNAPTEELPEMHVTLSTNNLDHSSRVTLETVDDRKRMSRKNENMDIERDPNNSHVESQFSVHHNAHHSSRTFINDNPINEDMRNECLPENTPVPDSHHSTSRLNRSDSQDNINECNFLKENIENSLVELESINPPSFVLINSDEDNSFNLLSENESQASNVIDVVSNNINCSLERLKSMSAKCDQVGSRQVSTIANIIEDNREAGLQVVTETVINDDRVNESVNCCTTGIAQLSAERLSSITDVNRKKTTERFSSTNHFRETEVTNRNHEVDEDVHIQDRIDDEVELRDTEEKRECSKIEEQLDAERCVDHLKETEVTIEDQIDRDNLSDEMNLRSMKQKDENIGESFMTEQCIEKSLASEQYVSAIENEPSQVEQHPFSSLVQKLETYAKSEDCIWNIYHKNFDKKVIAFGFMSNSLLIVTYLSSDLDYSQENSIKEIKVISLIADDVDVVIKIVHDLILEKVNAEILTHLYKTCEDILQMLDFVSQKVKLMMDFMFDLRKLDDLNLMEITRDKISFVSYSKYMNIILNITINVKSFDSITANDINIRCLLGTVDEEEVKILIKNIKKKCKFLRMYMNDVKDYIDIMEEIYNNRR